MKAKSEIKEEAIHLRSTGLSYTDILTRLSEPVSKSTLSNWLKYIKLSEEASSALRDKNLINLETAHRKSVEKRKLLRQEYLYSIELRNTGLEQVLMDEKAAKSILGILYLAEGSKNTGPYLSFGNTDPDIISFYLRLLRKMYQLDESKFRCTVQMRSDQNSIDLNNFWSDLTQIPLNQFYKARVDKRTEGKPTKKIGHKGVCRIDYFSADLLYEILSIGRLLTRTTGP